MSYNTKVRIEQGGERLVVESGGTLLIASGATIQAAGGSTVTGFGSITQAAAITDLTITGVGTPNNLLSALQTISDSPATADALRDELQAIHWPVMGNNFADLGAKINEILAALRTAGIIAT